MIPLQICVKAIEGLGPFLELRLRPSARIILARQFSVGSWLRTGLIDLVAEVNQKKLTPSLLTNTSETESPLDAITVANVFFACYELASGGNGSTIQKYCGPCTKARKNMSATPIDCQGCKATRVQIAREEAVNRIFGSEIKECAYDKIQKTIVQTTM